ncbi:hypothetical protein JFT91_13430 [Pseudomonas sp. TH08]|uniref:hypothetical protein n=1 Tax=unclassified Pseudomonas TaxID=196821 RepID=UPI001912A883|nr:MULTISPECIES: hypothetical protein [unclassified Pseudomonas]MBK5529211.1 hypothetical protein [Pseudomonas sp. TH06]MBK5533587.1 hypothetical protein [Pseudomonas sp. TH08]
MHTYILEYLFNGEPRNYSLELKQPQLAVHQAAMHLLELHCGDAENSLLMPTADSTAQEILAKAEQVGITQIQVED